jgi:hypothetical protein
MLPENASAYSITPEACPQAEAMEEAAELLYQSIVNNLALA